MPGTPTDQPDPPGAPSEPPVRLLASSEARQLASEPATACTNCGAVLPGRYCPGCGQKSEPLRLPVHRLAMDSFTEFFGVDGRVWRSFGGLLFRPGRLTTAFLAGQWTRYLRPLRLYLTTTLVFFVLLSLLDPVATIEQGLKVGGIPADTTVRVADRLAEVDSALVRGGRPDAADVRARALEEALVRDVVPADTAGDLAREITFNVNERVGAARSRAWALDSTRLAIQRGWLAQLPGDSLVEPARVERAAVLLVPDPEGDGFNVSLGALQPSTLARRVQEAEPGPERQAAAADLLRGSIGRVPTVMFLLLPLFAALLKLLYLRRGWFYSEHVVFALVAVLLWADSLGPGATAARGVLLAVPAHFVLAQKRVYGQSWGKTLVKAAALAWLYALLLLVGMAGAIALVLFVG